MATAYSATHRASSMLNAFFQGSKFQKGFCWFARAQIAAKELFDFYDNTFQREETDLEVDALPAEGTALSAGDRQTGELTSLAVSPRRGSIALGYVRREHAEAGTEVTFDGGTGRVVELPFVDVGEAPA